MKELNKLIREFDFEKADLELLSSKFTNLKENICALKMTIPKGRAIYRCRENNQFEEQYYFEKDISYRTDLKNIKSIGRANHPFSSKFYGSLTPMNNDILEGYDLSIFETSEMWRNDDEGVERYTIGKWILKEDLKVYVVIPDQDKERISDLNSELIDVYKEFATKFKLTSDQKEFIELIGKEFSKKIKDGESLLYGVSSTFAEFILEKKQIYAIAYPSVQSEMKGFNIVMNPSKADSCLKLERVFVADLYKFRKHVLLSPLYTADLKNDYPFYWEDVSKEKRVSLEEIIQQFRSNDVHPHDIISALINQIKNNHFIAAF